MSRDVYYAWVRVGNGEPEPAAITGEKPHRKATTFGCPDAFDVDDPESGCSIVMMAAGYPAHPLYARAEEAEIERIEDDHGWSHCVEVSTIDAEKREAAYQAAVKIKPHRYAGFGRRP